MRPIHPHQSRIVQQLRDNPQGLTTDQIAVLARCAPRSVRQAMTVLRRHGFRIACRQLFVLTHDAGA